MLEELVERLPEGAKVLDAGCGAGVHVTKFLSKFFDVTGVDFAKSQVRLAHQLVPQARFICQDVTKLVFPDETFDAICSYYAIIHIPREEHQRLLWNFHRMLKPSGLILLCMGAGDLEDDINENYLNANMYWSHYDSKTNIKMLKDGGFSIIWAKIMEDSTSPGSSHLFVLAQKS